MKVCLILEGCYPYVRGGVSTWAHEYIRSRPDTQFVLWTVHANRDSARKRLYDVPENVVEMREIFLEDAFASDRKRDRTDPQEQTRLMEGLSRFVTGDGIDCGNVLQLCHKCGCTASALAKSEAFLRYAVSMADAGEESIGLSDMFYGLRSMLMPIVYVLKQEIPEADVYHSSVAGYGGILGALAHLETGKPFILTEHGIYPREREEELMQAAWVPESMKDLWIRLFYNLSRCAYQYAARVTSLFTKAMERQREIGCDGNKCRIVANGIYYERFGAVGPKTDDGHINIGAFIRFSPIKDVKTLIRAFHSLSMRVPNAVLYIMGGTDDEAYERDCRELIDRMRVKNIRIEGHVDTVEYLKKMDFTVMTSISEGQPLAILESLAAGRPCVTTNVGNCMELLERPEDDCGPAGFCRMPMDVEGLAQAMEIMCKDREMRERFGRNGRERAMRYYTHDRMMERYFKLYDEVL